MKSGVHHFSYVIFLSLAMSLFHSVFPGSLNEISHWNEKKKFGVKRNRWGSRQVMRIKKINQFRDYQYQFLQITIIRIVWQIIRRITDLILGAIVVTYTSLLINGDDWKWASKTWPWCYHMERSPQATDIFNRTTTTDYRGSSSEGGSKKGTVASYCE